MSFVIVVFPESLMIKLESETCQQLPLQRRGDDSLMKLSGRARWPRVLSVCTKLPRGHEYFINGRRLRRTPPQGFLCVSSSVLHDVGSSAPFLSAVFSLQHINDGLGCRITAHLQFFMKKEKRSFTLLCETLISSFKPFLKCFQCSLIINVIFRQGRIKPAPVGVADRISGGLVWIN